MTRAEALSLLREYCEAEPPVCGCPTCDVIADTYGMADRFPKDGSEAKAMRWLGYMQGVMVATHWYTLEQVKQHSKNVSLLSPEEYGQQMLDDETTHQVAMAEEEEHRQYEVGDADSAMAKHEVNGAMAKIALLAVDGLDSEVIHDAKGLATGDCPTGGRVSRVEEIRERWAQASPAPWVHDAVCCCDDHEHDQRLSDEAGLQLADVGCEREYTKGEACLLGHYVYGAVDEDSDTFSPRTNAEAIAHAPDDIAWLLAEVERLSAARHNR